MKYGQKLFITPAFKVFYIIYYQELNAEKIMSDNITLTEWPSNNIRNVGLAKKVKKILDKECLIPIK